MGNLKEVLEKRLEKLKESSVGQAELQTYKCSKCKDRMFIEKGGGYIPCDCRQVRIAEEKLKQSGISEEFKTKRFNNFNAARSDSIKQAYGSCIEYIKQFKQIKNTRHNSMMLCGQVGSGKTHLACAISNKLLEGCVGVIYMPYRLTITDLKQSITDKINFQREMNRYQNAQVLFIDDLFKGKYTESDINIIYEIIDYRYLKNLPMIITTEKTIDDLIDIDEAIASRIYEMSKGFTTTIEGKELNYRMYGS